MCSNSAVTINVDLIDNRGPTVKWIFTMSGFDVLDKILLFFLNTATYCHAVVSSCLVKCLSGLHVIDTH